MAKKDTLDDSLQQMIAKLDQDRRKRENHRRESVSTVTSRDARATVSINAMGEMVGVGFPGGVDPDALGELEQALLDAYEGAYLAAFFEYEDANAHHFRTWNLPRRPPWESLLSYDRFLTEEERLDLSAGVWLHWRKRPWSLAEMSRRVALPQQVVLDLVVLLEKPSESKERLEGLFTAAVRRFAALFATSPQALLRTGRTQLHGWRLCRAARELQKRRETPDMISPSPERDEYDRELRRLMKKHDMDEPAQALAAEESTGAFEIDPSPASYPRDPALALPDGTHPLDYHDPVGAAVYHERARQLGRTLVEVLEVCRVPPPAFCAYLKDGTVYADPEDVHRHRQRINEHLGWEDWRGYDDLADEVAPRCLPDWLAARFLEERPGYEIPPSLERLQSWAAVKRWRKARPRVGGHSETMAAGALEAHWSSSRLTADEVAHRAGLDVWLIQKLLRGYDHFPRSLAARLASVFGVDEEEFVRSGYAAYERALFKTMDSARADPGRAGLLESLYTVTGNPANHLAYRRYTKLRARLGEQAPLERLFEAAAETVGEVSVDEIYAEPSIPGDDSVEDGIDQLLP